METVLLILTVITQSLKFIAETLWNNLYDYMMTTLSIVILLDDFDAINAIENVKKKNIRSKVEERNETFEATTTTKGHTDPTIQKRYIRVMFMGFLIILVEEYLIPCNIISKVLSVCALSITIMVKRKCNQNYDRLKRKKAQ